MPRSIPARGVESWGTGSSVGVATADGHVSAWGMRPAAARSHSARPTCGPRRSSGWRCCRACSTPTARSTRTGTVELCLADRALLRQARELVCSLGHKPGPIRRAADPAARRPPRRAWRFAWTPLDPVFRLSPEGRALAEAAAGSRRAGRTARRAITAIRPVAVGAGPLHHRRLPEPPLPRRRVDDPHPQHLLRARASPPTPRWRPERRCCSSRWR